MSKTKRLEKEIDYLKAIIGILAVLCAGLSTWFVSEKTNSLLFQTIAIGLFLVFFYVIIESHKKIKVLLDELEDEND